MATEKRRKFDRDFREGAVRLVRETGKPIAQVARELGIHDGTLGNWVNADRHRRGESDGGGGLSEDERAELVRLRRENAELRMLCDVLKRSVARARVAAWIFDEYNRDRKHSALRGVHGRMLSPVNYELAHAPRRRTRRTRPKAAA